MFQQKIAADKEKKNLMYIGAGIIGIMLVAMMMRKRQSVAPTKYTNKKNK